MAVVPVNLNGLAYKNLPERLDRAANNIENDGWLSAARLMRNAADVLQDLHDRGLIKLEIDNEA